jgi:hypothetical protein
MPRRDTDNVEVHLLPGWKTNLNETGREDMDWIHLAQDRNQ